MNTRILLVLDESSSMLKQKAKVVEAINNMINIQKSKNSYTILTLIKFNSTVEKAISNCIKDFKFGYEDYSPKDATALYDAIGGTLFNYQHEINNVFIVATDGDDNCSRKYRPEHISFMIQKLRTLCGWKFIYLCENKHQAITGKVCGFESLGTDSYNLVTNSLASGIDDVQNLILNLRI